MEENLKRREGESLFEWKLRLSLMKLNKETDLDWCELVELLEIDMSADHYRKLSYGYKEYDDYIKSKTKDIEIRHIAVCFEMFKIIFFIVFFPPCFLYVISEFFLHLLLRL